MRAILLTAILLLSAAPVASAATAPTAGTADCYGGTLANDASCFAKGAVDPVVRTCDVIGLPQLVLCVVNSEIDNAQAFADEVCRPICTPATTASGPCDGVVPATGCFVEEVLFVLCIPEPPIVGPLRCFVSNAVDATERYAGRLCDAAFGSC